MNLHTLLARLKASGLAVCTTGDVCRITGLPRDSAAVYVHRMKERGMVFPVERGKFAVTEDPFQVASQVAFPSYLSFTTAFYLHGRMQQVIDRLYVVTPRRRPDLEFMGSRVRFVAFPPGRVFGYRREGMGGSFAMVADLEKAAVDCLYRPRVCPLPVVAEALKDGFDRRSLERHARAMGSEAVIRRAGYLMEELGVKTRLRPTTRAPYIFDPSTKRKGEYDRRWKMYVNEVV